MSILRDMMTGRGRRYGMPSDLGWATFLPRFERARATMVCVRADNVAEWVFSGTDQEVFTRDDYPQMAPPFKSMWIECNVPPVIRSEEFGNTQSRVTSIANLIVAYDTETTAEWVETGRNGRKSGRMVDVRWTLQSFVLTRTSGVIGLQPWVLHQLIGPDGTIVQERYLPFSKETLEQLAQAKANGVTGLGSVSIVANMAISLMHCRNVTMRDEMASFADRHARKGPRYTWKTLEIEPFKAVARKQNNDIPTGIKHALHICRGHFKDYRQSGLFGKIKGVFWWGPALRGSAEHGEVVKDYAVKAAAVH